MLLLIFGFERKYTDRHARTHHVVGLQSEWEQTYLKGGIQRANIAIVRDCRGVLPHPVAGTGRFRRRQSCQKLADVHPSDAADVVEVQFN